MLIIDFFFLFGIGMGKQGSLPLSLSESSVFVVDVVFFSGKDFSILRPIIMDDCGHIF